MEGRRTVVIHGGMLVDAASTPACGYRTLAPWNKAPFNQPVRFELLHAAARLYRWRRTVGPGRASLRPQTQKRGVSLWIASRSLRPPALILSMALRARRCSEVGGGSSQVSPRNRPHSATRPSVCYRATSQAKRCRRALVFGRPACRKELQARPHSTRQHAQSSHSPPATQQRTIEIHPDPRLSPLSKTSARLNICLRRPFFTAVVFVPGASAAEPTPPTTTNGSARVVLQITIHYTALALCGVCRYLLLPTR